MGGRNGWSNTTTTTFTPLNSTVSQSLRRSHSQSLSLLPSLLNTPTFLTVFFPLIASLSLSLSLSLSTIFPTFPSLLNILSLSLINCFLLLFTFFFSQFHAPFSSSFFIISSFIGFQSLLNLISSIFFVFVFLAMEFEQHKALSSPMTFDEASMERSKSFVKALQELKNLRPQLYSAAEYCEKSYLHSEQKQMVLDNLKDYAVRALVNAVDHLGTVAYKLTDLLEQQNSDMSTTELKVTCLNQKLLTCHTYMEMEGLRQQQLLAIIPRHHKRYVLPNSVNKKVHFSPATQTDTRQMHVQARPRVHPAGSPGSKTLSWHLGSETKTPLKGSHRTVISRSEVQRTPPRSPAVFQLLDKEDDIQVKSSVHAQLSSVNSAGASLQPYGAMPKAATESKAVTPYRSLDNSRQAIVKAPVRQKSMLSAFFVKQKTAKLRTGKVA